MDLEIRHAARIVLATMALAPFAAYASGSAPAHQLPPWTAPRDCATAFAPPAYRLAPAQDAAPALLVDSDGAERGWNCAEIPHGRYEAIVQVRWSNGNYEPALHTGDMVIAPGRQLVARAHELGKGAIPASFVGIQSIEEPAKPEEETIAAAPAPEPQVVEALPSSADTGASPVDPAPEQASTPADGGTPVSRETVLTAIGIALAPITLPIVAAALILQLPYIAAGALAGKMPQPGVSPPPVNTQPVRPSPGCCFVWIEDGRTGELVAGERPPR